MRPSQRLLANPLEIANSKIRDAVLNGIPSTGPPSLRSRWARSRYTSPSGLAEAFKAAREITLAEKKSRVVRAEVLGEQAKAESDPDRKRRLESMMDHALASSEWHNPEVRFNHLVQSRNIDMSLPVYRKLAYADWRKRDLLILMQRLEQHHVIPDTLPTLKPRAQVQLRFVTPSPRWIEPGEWITTGVSDRVPELRVQEFSKIPDSSAYTVLIVNPDVPDLENDSYKTSLHFAAAGIPLSNNDPLVDWSKADIIADYIPPHPEKNAGPQRLCVWVLRQPDQILKSSLEFDRDDFDIRKFVEQNNLDAVGAHLWRSEWDLETEAVREKHGLKPGNVFFRARTAKAEDSLLHISHRKRWIQRLRVPDNVRNAVIDQAQTEFSEELDLQAVAQSATGSQKTSTKKE